MRGIIIAVLVVVVGSLATLVLERCMSRAPEWVWRLAYAVVIIGGMSIALLTDPLYEFLKGFRVHPYSSIAVVGLAAGIFFATVWCFWIVGFPSSKAYAVANQTNSSGDQAREQDQHVGFLQFDKLEYERSSGFVAGKPFTVQVWFTNRGSFPVYSAQGFALLVNSGVVYDGADTRIHRLARRAVRQEWQKQPASQVAVGGSIFFRTSANLSQEEIDRIFSGHARLYLFTFARWRTASGKRVLTEWDECSSLEPPELRDFNRLELRWRACDAAPIPAQSSAAQMQALDELREEGRQLLEPPTGQLPPRDRVNRWMEKAQLYVRTNIPEYVNEFDQMEKDPRPIGPDSESPLWFNNLDRQVEGRRLAAILSFLDLIREELYSKLP